MLSGGVSRAQLQFEAPPVSSDTGAQMANAPVLNKPYLAHKHVHTDRRLADGTPVSQDSDVSEARNSQGLVATTVHQTAAGGKEQHLIIELHVVFDPTARTLLTWNNLAKSALLLHLPAEQKVALNGAPATAIRPESLGHRVVCGFAVEGTRTEVQVPGGSAGSATPLRTTRVEWRNDALQAVLERTEISAKTGTVLTTLVDLKPGEPDGALFHIPEGYLLQDTPAPGTAARIAAAGLAPVDHAHLPVMTYDDAMQAMDQHNTAPTAAAVLMQMAAGETDLQRRNREIYAVVRKGLELPAAEAQAQANVSAGEQALAHPDTAAPPDPATLLAQHRLAQYWDTLGYTLQREQKDGMKYLLAAWTLDPLAYYGSHLGRAYEDLHQVTLATDVYRAALERDGSPEMKQTIQERLQALSGAGAPAASQPTAVQAEMETPRIATVEIDYAAGSKPDVHFSQESGILSGRQAVGAPGESAVAQAAASWQLPDVGPEHVMRLVQVTCNSPITCQLRNLPMMHPH